MLWARRQHVSNESFWAYANADFGRSVVKRGFQDTDTVYGFNAAAVEILAAAKQRGLRTVLDQTMAPWKCVESLLDEERERWPDWTSEGTEGDQTGILTERESQEWSNADLIICGSTYVAQAVAEVGGPADRCRVVPYGYDGKSTATFNRPTHTASEALRVLFVGTVDLRKGLPYLHQAAERIDRNVAVFRVVGPIRIPESTVQQLSQRVDVVGPVPRSEVSRHYQWADVVLLPTLAEGSANVCYESMSHGVPVITTPNAGSVIRDGIDGWIVAIRSADAIADCVAHLAGHRDILEEASRHAYERASEFTWDRYMKSLAEVISVAAPSQSDAETVSTAH